MAAMLFGVLFHMAPMLALAGGFAVAATSPEAVMAGLTRLARKGFGVSSGVCHWDVCTSSVLKCCCKLA